MAASIFTILAFFLSLFSTVISTLTYFKASEINDKVQDSAVGIYISDPYPENISSGESVSFTITIGKAKIVNFDNLVRMNGFTADYAIDQISSIQYTIKFTNVIKEADAVSLTFTIGAGAAISPSNSHSPEITSPPFFQVNIE